MNLIVLDALGELLALVLELLGVFLDAIAACVVHGCESRTARAVWKSTVITGLDIRQRP